MIDKNQYRENQLIVHPPFGEKYESITVQCSLCRQQMIHMHDCLEIIYVFRGRIEVKISFEKNILEAGEFFAVNQYEVHSIKSIDSEALIASIYISDRLLPVEKGFIVWWPEALKYDKGIYDNQAANIRNLITQYASNTVERVIMINVNNIIRIFHNELKVEAFHRNGSPGDYSESELKRIHNMYMYMYEHLDEKLSLEKIASDFAMSPSYMSHYIKSVTGYNFQTSMAIIRCERAETDILGSRLTIYEISEKYGFSSSRYFSSVFRKYFGTTPSEYRKTHLKNTISHNKNQETLIDNIPNYINEKEHDSSDHSVTLALDMGNAEITIVNNSPGKETVDHFTIRGSENARIKISSDETILIIKKA